MKRNCKKTCTDFYGGGAGGGGGEGSCKLVNQLNL